MSYMDDNQIAAISRLFSSSVLQEMARHGESPLLARLVVEYDLLDFALEMESVEELFENAFSLLKKKQFRYEYIYKAALTHRVLIGKHKLNASLLTEFRVGKCKADVVILNGTGTVYEIKTDRDSLARLANQIESYMKVFATVNVIAGENHIDAVKLMLPEEVGILKLSGRYTISEEREGKDLPERTCPVSIFESVQIKEAKQILESLGVDVPNVPNTKMYEALRPCFERLNPKKTHEAMVNTLKQTRNLLALGTLISELPPSLQAAALSTPLRKQDYPRLLEAINTPIQDALRWA